MMRNELHFVSIADRTKHLRDQWWDTAPSSSILSSSDVFAKKKKKKNSTSPLLSSAVPGSRSKNKKNKSRSSNSIESGKRSKQGGGEENNTSLSNSTIKHYENSSTPPCSEDHAGILIMVMGEKSKYAKWNSLWNNYLESRRKAEDRPYESALQDVGMTKTNVSSSSSAPQAFSKNCTRQSSSFIYASYDDIITTNNTNSSTAAMDLMMSSRTIFIPGTTWTEGRNKLAQEALTNEKIRKQTYKYWVFLDDDIDFICKKGTFGRGGQMIAGFENTSETTSGQYCWNMFLNFLDSDNDLVPKKVTTVTLKRGRHDKHFTAASKPDAIVAAFKRQSLPYILPYATLQSGESQFNSQKVVFCVMKTCLKQSAMYVPYIHVKNNEHREYPRGFNLSSFVSTVGYNYNEYLNLQHCSRIPEYHENGNVDVLTTQIAQDLDKMIPSMNSSCDTLRSRFYDWQRSLEDE